LKSCQPLLVATSYNENSGLIYETSKSQKQQSKKNLPFISSMYSLVYCKKSYSSKHRRTLR